MQGYYIDKLYMIWTGYNGYTVKHVKAPRGVAAIGVNLHLLNTY